MKLLLLIYKADTACLTTSGKGMGEVQNRVRFHLEFIANSRRLGGSSVELQLQRMKQVLKLEKQFYVLVVINSVRLASFPGSLHTVLQAMESWAGPGNEASVRWYDMPLSGPPGPSIAGSHIVFCVCVPCPFVLFTQSNSYFFAFTKS